VLLGSILPDLDERNSKINQWSGFIGKIIVFFFKHRGLLHSLLFHVGLFVLVSYTFNTYYAAALFIGYIAHLIGDGITPMGVQVLYPFSKFKLRGPFRVGGFVEKIIMVSLSVFILFRFL
jgi:inner membrane protein